MVYKPSPEIMKMKFLFLGLAAAFMASCGSSRQTAQSTGIVGAAGDVEIIIPCSGLEFTSSPEFFRANSMGVSTNLEIAGQKAMTSARAKLAASIETTIKTVTDKYISSYEEGISTADRGRYQSITREVVNQRLNGIRTICQKTMQGTDGQYKCYVAIELAGDELVKAVSNTISDDSKLRTDFEYQKFLQTYEEEMSNFGK